MEPLKILETWGLPGGVIAVVSAFIGLALKLRRQDAQVRAQVAASGKDAEEAKTEQGVIGKLHLEFQRMSASLLDERKEVDRLRGALHTSEQECARHAVATVNAEARAVRAERDNDRLRELIGRERPDLSARVTPRLPSTLRMRTLPPMPWPADAPTPLPPPRA